MRTRKPAQRPAVVAVHDERRLFLSPAGVRTVRSRVTPTDRERLDGMLAAGTVRVVTTKES